VYFWRKRRGQSRTLNPQQNGWGGFCFWEGVFCWGFLCGEKLFGRGVKKQPQFGVKLPLVEHPQKVNKFVKNREEWGRNGKGGFHTKTKTRRVSKTGGLAQVTFFWTFTCSGVHQGPRAKHNLKNLPQPPQKNNRNLLGEKGEWSQKKKLPNGNPKKRGVPSIMNKIRVRKNQVHRK